MIIDCHVHIGDWSSTESLDRIVGSGLTNGINKLIVSALGEKSYIAYPTPEEFVSANNIVLNALNKYPDILLGICYVNPKYPEEALAEIERCIANGPMIGIKLWVSVKASDPIVEIIARKALELEVPILQHAWYKATGNMPDESTPMDVVVLARKFPDLRIHMAHLYGAGLRGIADIADYKNIYVDTSGSEPEAWILEYAVEQLGDERILFGSDAPGRSFGVQLGKVMGADIAEHQKQLILSENAIRFYDLSNA